MSQRRVRQLRVVLNLLLISAASACAGSGSWQQPNPAWPAPGGPNPGEGAQAEGGGANPADAPRTAAPEAPGIPGRPDWADSPSTSEASPSGSSGPGGTAEAVDGSPETDPRSGRRWNTEGGPVPTSGLIGTWNLVAMGSISGKRTDRMIGTLVVNRTHLSLHLAGGPDPDRPELRSVVRAYRFEKGRLIMTTLLGHSIFKGDEVVVDPIQGSLELRVAWLQTGSMRLFEPGGTYLEFAPIQSSAAAADR